MLTDPDSGFGSIENLIIEAGAAIMVRKWSDTFPPDRFVAINGKDYMLLSSEDLVEYTAMVVKATRASEFGAHNENGNGKGE